MIPLVDDDDIPTDRDTTAPASTKASVHTGRVFPKGNSDRSVLTEYADHVTYTLWQEEVYMLYFVIENYLLLFLISGKFTNNIFNFVACRNV